MSSIELPATDRINELTKSDQLLNLTTNRSDDDQVSNDQLNSLMTEFTDLADSQTRLSVQNIPHSVHSLTDLSNDAMKGKDIVKSDGQLHKLDDDDFISSKIKLDKSETLNKSVEILKLEPNLDQLVDPDIRTSSASLSKASMNNLLLDERSLNELNRTPLNAPISETFSNDQTMSARPLHQASLNTASNRKASLKQTTFLNTGTTPEKASSLVELNDTNQKLKEKGKQSTGSIDFIPNFIANQSTFDDEPTVNRINTGLDDEMTIDAYVQSIHKELLYYLVCVLTFGLFLVYCEMKTTLKIRLTHRRCPLGEATVIVLRDQNNFEFVERIHRPNRNKRQITNDFVHFYHKKLKYILDADRQQFTKLTGLESEKCEVIYSYASGLTHQEAEDKFNLYGLNSIYIDVQPLWKIIVESVSDSVRRSSSSLQ